MFDVVHRTSRLTPRAPASGKPSWFAFGKTNQPKLPVVLCRFCEAAATGGPGPFGPNPSGFGSAVALPRPSPNPSTLCQMSPGRVIQYSQDLL